MAPKTFGLFMELFVGTLVDSDKPPYIHVIRNWYEEFRDREQD